MSNFQEEYREIYNRIRPDCSLVERVRKLAEEEMQARGFPIRETAGQAYGGGERYGKRIRGRLLRDIAAAAVIILGIGAVLPVSAARIPGFYRAIERISPGLGDLLVPVEESCTKKGITMTVEAVSLSEKEARVLFSFMDEEGSGEDKIRGPIDTYDSYRLVSHTESAQYSGCRNLGYDEETGKAYLEVQTAAESEFCGDKLTFAVRELLCESRKEEREISLAEIDFAPRVKTVTISGSFSGGAEEERQKIRAALKAEKSREEADTDPRPAWKVMDTGDAGRFDGEGITITGVGYADGILRVQRCMGDLSHADRHVLTCLSGGAEEKTAVSGVQWKEPANGVWYTFGEEWYLVEEAELERCSLRGIFHMTEEPVEGDWEVTFRLEEK